MNRKNCLRYAQATALGLLVLAAATPSFAQTTIELAAVETTWAPPGGGAIPMWGFVAVGDAATYDCATPAPAWGLGPQIDVLTPGTSLTINIKNCLTSDPVSVFIPGQAKATVPETFVDGQGRTRVKSFDADILAGSSGSYTWNSVRQGTFLYHSGSHPQVAVQMGLYGVLTVGSYPYPTEQTVVFSEIDPALHAAVAAGNYGPGKAVTSTFDYYPEYYLINGAAYPEGADIGVNVSQDTLIRFVNAGLKNRVPTLQNLYMTLIAEDGFAYPEALQQYSVLLPPAKSIDAVLNVGAEGRYALYDRSLGLTNAGVTGGGMLTFIQTGVFSGPVAVNDPAVAGAYTIAEDAPGGLVIAAPGVLGNDTFTAPGTAALVSGPSAGTLAGGLAADGAFTYTPGANFNGNDFFTYTVSDGSGVSNVATATITVTPVNDPPVAVADAYNVPDGQTLSVAAPGVLGNDSDVDGDSLTASVAVAPPAGAILVLNPNGSFDYTPAGAAGAIETFDYQACDPSSACTVATVTITVDAAAPNVAPTAYDVNAQTTKNTPVVFNITFNDVDPDGTIDTATVDVNQGVAGIQNSGPTSRGGSVIVDALGNATYTPKSGFRGTDTFNYTVNDNDGATSNVATVRINVK